MGKEERYRQLLLMHRKVIWAVCYFYAHGEKKLVEDLVQEVSVALFMQIDDLNPDATVLQERKWVRWRSRAVIKKVLPKLQSGFRELNEEVTLPIVLSQYADSDLMEDIMSHLTVDERELLQFEIDGYSPADIADKMGIKVSAYYQRKHRIIVKLKDTYNR